MKRSFLCVLALLLTCVALCAPRLALGQGTRLIQPSDFEYKGAFRLPDGPEEFAWLWSGAALTYYPGGDPKGPDDGYPGSLFGVGHDWNNHVSEIGIPAPVVSAAKNLDELNTATTLQEFKDITGGMFGEMEQPRVGLEYLPKQGEQQTDKLYFCRAPHLGDVDKNPSHGWCELDLANPQPAGPWRIGDYRNYVTTHYIFQIPKAWADQHVRGMRLATGRYRDGGQASQGPSLFAIAPWAEGNPPPRDAQIHATPLLLYPDVAAEEQHKMKDYQHADEWTAGAWLTAGEKSAVIFIGTKAKGKCWYGFPNGVVWPEEGPWPPVPDPPNDGRGWWATEFVGQIVFYNPDDLAAVAKGEKKPHEPQPYATLDIDKWLYNVKSKQQVRHVRGAAFGRARGLLYVIEFRGDEDKSLIHVWQVKG
ncbi:MAG: hypothetical protein AB1696_11030 [Planctomycetota bacterium]